MKKRGRKPLPADRKKVRIAVYAPASVVEEIHSIARQKGMTASEFTALFYLRARDYYRPQKTDELQT